MIRARLETLYSQGYIEGWAYDAEAPTRALLVEVRDANGASVALGYAHGYREALARQKLAGGWCGFRLRVNRDPNLLREAALTLFDMATSERIFYTDRIGFADGWAPEFEVGEDTITYDPFILERVQQLRGLNETFDAYVKAHGSEGFVRAAYVYIFSRAADPEGLMLYTRMLEDGSLTPYKLLELFSETTEFKSRTSQLAAPKAPAFPFFEAEHAR